MANVFSESINHVNYYKKLREDKSKDDTGNSGNFSGDIVNLESKDSFDRSDSVTPNSDMNNSEHGREDVNRDEKVDLKDAYQLVKKMLKPKKKKK